ncbi:MAG: amidohydrolase family protein [Bryobacterales bacterium]|nr:amidohydrolase family protein [Bryobacterales bacterium]
MNRLLFFVGAVIFGGVTLKPQPAADHHLHLLRSTIAPPQGFALTAEELIRQMDDAGIQRGVVLSVAYQFGNPFRPAVANEYARVKAENNWTASQAALYKGRLVAFCGVNPLKEYALREIDRCAKHPGLRRGLKLHFGNSDVELDKPGHVAQMKRVFAAANRHRMAIVVHIRPNIDHGRPWGAKQARIFLEHVLPEAGNVVVQIAHLASAGRYEDEGVDKALDVFVDAIVAKDARVKLMHFDVSVMAWESKQDTLQRQLRAIGMERLLYASDSPPPAAWKSFRKLPLSERELKQIEKNVAPYLR